MTTVLWDEDPNHGVVVEPAELMQATLEAVELLRSARTFGEVRQADLPAWVDQLVASMAESHEDQFDEPPADDTPWPAGEITESIIDVVPLPWDAASVEQWLEADVLRRHAQVGGASPGGNIDGYHVDDREAFLSALEQVGYTLERRSGLVQAFEQAL